MIKIGITGSIASGKTTASKILSGKKWPLFSADQVVRKLYKKKSFKTIVSKKTGLRSYIQFKKKIRENILNNKRNLVIVEKIIHPIVRKEMFIFLKRNNKNKILIFEVPLLVENKLIKYFDKVIFIKSSKKLRLKRFKSKRGDVKLFNILDNKQIKDTKKMKFCDYVVVNNKTISVLKKKLFNIIKNYE